RYYMNKVILIGNVGADPQETTFENGNKLASFPLATSRRYKDKEGNLLEHTSWHRIRFTGNNADKVMRVVKKSALVQLEGSIRYDTYTNKDNVEVNSTTISGDNFKIL
ncbi:single-strand binding protein, partial [Linderina pennispora]